MGRKVLMIVSNEFNPDVRVDKEARALVEQGYEVTVLAWDRYRRKLGKESLGGYNVVRLRTGQIDRKWLLPFGLPLFFLSSLRFALHRRPDIIHCHDLDTLPQGNLAAKVMRIPLVYDAHEHYAAMIEQDLPRGLARLADGQEFRCLKTTTLVIAANESIASYLAPHSKTKPVVVMNVVDPGPPTSPPPARADGKVVLLYAGVLEPLRYIEELIQAVAGRTDVVLKIAGSGSLQDKVEGTAKSTSNVVYLGRISPAEVRKEMIGADAIVALLDPTNENNRIGTPNRLFEAMAAGRPALVSKGTLSARIVNEEGCGIALDWSVEEFGRTVAALSDRASVGRMGQKGREAAERMYNWVTMKGRLIEAYSDLPARPQ